MSALRTYCKLLTEKFSVSDEVIVEGAFDFVKVGHMNYFDLKCAVKERKEKLCFMKEMNLESYALSVELFLWEVFF